MRSLWLPLLLCFAAAGGDRAKTIAWRPAMDFARSSRRRLPRPLQTAIFHDNTCKANGSLLFLSADAEHSMSEKLSTPPEDLRILLQGMIGYFESMVDPHSQRFFLYSNPLDASKSHAYSPLRDLGSAWDACKALKLLKHYNNNSLPTTTNDVEPSSANQILEGAVLQTIEHYCSSLIVEDYDGSDYSHLFLSPKNLKEPHNSMMYLSPENLKEPPNIAHNALLLLALVESKDLNLWDDQKILDGLASGILSMQRFDGAFWTQFAAAKNDESNTIYRDVEFLPGQAMTALMEVHLRCGATTDRILLAGEFAFDFYRGYYQECIKQCNLNANYCIWQIQAFSRLALGLRQQLQQPKQLQQLQPRSFDDIETSRVEVTNYCLEMCQDILRSPAWKLLSRGESYYANLSTIEIACGLDALCQGYHLLLLEEEDDKRSNSSMDCERLEFLLRKHMDEALAFLKWSQDRLAPDAPTYGGLGHGGYCVREQRLDVTGHAIGAVSNLVLLPPG